MKKQLKHNLKKDSNSGLNYDWATTNAPEQIVKLDPYSLIELFL